jgi:hypothetical protein
VLQVHLNLVLGLTKVGRGNLLRQPNRMKAIGHCYVGNGTQLPMSQGSYGQMAVRNLRAPLFRCSDLVILDLNAICWDIIFEARSAGQLKRLD